MRVDCPRCSLVFVLDDRLVPPQGAAVQCTHCGTIFFAERPEPKGLVECPACHTTFRADLPGGTAVKCSKCDEVFTTPSRGSGKRLELAGATPGRGGRSPTPSGRPGARKKAPGAGPSKAAARLSEELREVGAPRRGEPPRRWFSSRSLDLIVWLDERGAPRSFRLCYDKQTQERAVTWSEGKFAHAVVDSGEQHRSLSYKQGTLLVSDIEFDARRVAALFEAVRDGVPPDLARFVAEKLASRTAGLPVATPVTGPRN